MGSTVPTIHSDMQVKHPDLYAGFKLIVDHLRSNTKNQTLLENFVGTEDRCVKALIETCNSDKEIADKLRSVIKTLFPVSVPSNDLEGMVTQGPISVNSRCPHHLAVVRYEGYVSYLPQNGQVLGLSKLVRIAQILGNRPVLHEQLASDIADALCSSEPKTSPFPGISSNGSAVMLTGIHTCLACRGVQEPALTHIVELRGNFWKDGGEQKFYQAVAAIKSTKVF